MKAEQQNWPEQEIIAFFQDEEGDWAARLACGHGRHMRHRPPMEDRPWVLRAETRQPYLGTHIPCAKCALQEDGS